jgi:hypothetical protein
MVCSGSGSCHPAGSWAGERRPCPCTIDPLRVVYAREPPLQSSKFVYSMAMLEWALDHGGTGWGGAWLIQRQLKPIM